jgi:hypothetical protein
MYQKKKGGMLFEKYQCCPFGEVTFVPRFLCESTATMADMIDLLLTGDNPFKSLVITERMGNTASIIYAICVLSIVCQPPFKL